MKREKLIAFIVFAKKHGYANPEGASEIIKHEKSGEVEIIVRKDKWKYTDIYCGSDSFSGRETVYYENIPVWTMSYHGKVELAEKTKKQLLIQFLKRALLNVSETSLFRGQDLHWEQTSEFTYVNSSHGGLEFFNGEEMISSKSDLKLVYRLHYSGNIII